MPHLPPLPPRGLRERKRIETRQRIADVATVLFFTRGFDAVTIAEIAAAAGVSKVTVFNYFPRKEDILFDRQPEAEAMLTDAVENRGPDRTPVAAIRELLVDLVRRSHPLVGVGPNYDHFRRLVLASPTLVARAREAGEEMQDRVAELFAEAGGPLAGGVHDGAGVAEPPLAAALLMAAFLAVYRDFVGRQMAGEAPEDLVAPYAETLENALLRAERAIGAG
jgi:AcrR family transcriptional regulator